MSNFVDDLGQEMNLNSWPHQFTKTGSAEQVGENKNFQPEEGQNFKVMSQEMVCVHCHSRYWTIKQGPPPGPCPARNKNREIKRLLG